MAPGRKTGGRVRGTANKATREALERERIARQAQAEVNKARHTNTKLGKDMLEDYMMVFHNIAAVHQNRIAEAYGRGNAPTDKDLASFEKWGTLVVSTAKELANFQSPRFKAILTVAPPPSLAPLALTKGNVVNLQDPVALSRVYQNMVKRVVG